MNIGVVGATGLVGRTIVRILEERNIGIHTLSLFASPRSVGEKITFLGEEYVVSPLTEESFKGLDVALFSAGGAVSREYAPIAAAAGCIAIDNSSTWRMDVGVPLVVPEVNPDDVKLHKGIIANPKRIVVSTYQSPSGAGHKGVAQLESEIEGHVPELRISSHSIAYNTVFHKVGGINESSEEEIKMMNETRRIMHLPELPIAVTCVRVPVLGGHGESVAIETLRTVAPDNAREVLSSSAGIVVVDDPASDGYPTPLSASGTDLVYVGRIRNDSSVEHGLLLWVVADNLRKGAATNAVQILELLQ
jgi:aspartate-semialdehyde dehydrogenase